jgi:hypothetical protein
VGIQLWGFSCPRLQKGAFWNLHGRWCAYPFFGSDPPGPFVCWFSVVHESLCIITWFWHKGQSSWVNPTSAIFLFKEILWEWTVSRAPSSHPFDFYPTTDLWCGLIYWIYWIWTSHVIISFYLQISLL